MARAGAIWLDVLPSLAGFQAALRTGLRTSGTGEMGKLVGVDFGNGMASGARSGMAGVRAMVKAEADASAEAVRAASLKVDAARAASAQAAGRLNVAELKLNETRAKYGPLTSQVAAAELRLSTAQDGQARSADAAASAGERLTKMQVDSAASVAAAEARVLEIEKEEADAAKAAAIASDELAAARRRATDAAVTEAAGAIRNSDALLREATTADFAIRQIQELAVTQLREAEASDAAALRSRAAFGTLGGSAESAGKRISGSMQKAGKDILGLGALGVAAGFADFAIKGIKNAESFQKEMTLLVTAGGEAPKALAGVSAGIEKIAVGTGTSLTDLATGMYTLEKAGIRGASGLVVLKAAAQGAAAEGTDLGTMTNALTSIMRSYNLPASKAVSTTNELVAGSGRAKTTMQEFAGSLSTVLPIASSAHISFAQVAGAIDTLTSHGTSAQESTQELAFTIRALQAPNNVATLAFSQMGLSANDVSQKLGSRGLTGTIDLLSESVLKHMGPSGTVLLSTFNNSKLAAQDAGTMFAALPAAVQKIATAYSGGTLSLKDYRTELKALPADQAALGSQWVTTENKAMGFNQQLRSGNQASLTYDAMMKRLTGGASGLTTALMLTGGSAGIFKADVAAVGAAALKTGSNVSTWAATQATFNVRMGQFRQSITVAGVQLGTALLPPLTKFVGWMVKVMPSVILFAKQNWSWIKPAGIGVGALAVGLGAASVAMSAFGVASRVATGLTKLFVVGLGEEDVALAANPIGLAITALLALGVGLVEAYRHSQTFRTIVHDGLHAVGDAGMWLWKSALQPAFQGIAAAGRWMWTNVLHPTFLAVSSFVRNDLGPAVTWLWNNVARPAFQGIGQAIKIWWGIAYPIFNLAVHILIDVVGMAFQGLWQDYVRPTFHNMVALYNTVLKPMFSAFGNYISVVVVPKVAAGVSAIGSIWGGLKGLLETPIKFVIDTVLNNGLIAAFNWVAKKVGSAPMGLIPDPFSGSGASSGGGGSASAGAAGMLHAATGDAVPMGRYGVRGRDSVPALLMPDEHVWTTAEVSAAGGHDGVRALRKAALAGNLAGYAAGGPVGGILGAVGSAAKSVARGISSVAGDIWSALTNPGALLQKLAGAALGKLSSITGNPFGQLVAAVPKALLKGIEAKIKGFLSLAPALSSGGGGSPVGGWTWPVNPHPITQGYGGPNVHPGLDIGVPTGTTVVAAHDGTVMRGGSAAMSGGAGNFLQVAVSSGVHYAMEHLSSYGVAAGQQVKMGQPIARSGSTGNSTGPHLHFEIEKTGALNNDGSMANSLDPMKFLAGQGAGMGLPSGGTPTNFRGSAGVTQWAGMISRVLGMLGLSPGLLGRVETQMQTESGGNPNAINNWDSNARAGTPSKSLMQVTDPTFNQYRSPSLSGNIYDPEANIYAGLHYAESRYGSSLGYLGQGHGYDSGGWLQHNTVGHNTSGKPEAVLTADQSKAFIDVARMFHSLTLGSPVRRQAHRAEPAVHASKVPAGPVSQLQSTFTSLVTFLLQKLQVGLTGSAKTVQSTINTLISSVVRSYASVATLKGADEKKLTSYTARLKVLNTTMKTLPPVAKTYADRLVTLQAEITKLNPTSKAYAEQLVRIRGEIKTTEDAAGKAGKARSLRSAKLFAEITAERALIKGTTVDIRALSAIPKGQESAVLRVVAADNRALSAAATVRDGLVARISTADSDLAKQRAAAASYASSLQGKLISGTSVFDAPGGQASAGVSGTVWTGAGAMPVAGGSSATSATSAGGILANSRQFLANMQRFGGLLAQMKRKGFSANIIDQVAQSGVDAGTPVARSLLAGGATFVRQLNATQTAIGSQSSAIGNQQAAQTYGGAIATDTVTAARLTAQENALNKRMAVLGTRLQKTLIHALAGEGALNPYLLVGEQITAGVTAKRPPRAKPKPQPKPRHLTAEIITLKPKGSEGGGDVVNHFYFQPQHANVTLQEFESWFKRMELTHQLGRSL